MSTSEAQMKFQHCLVLDSSSQTRSLQNNFLAEALLSFTGQEAVQVVPPLVGAA